MFRFVIAALLALGATAEDARFISICSAANPNLLGKYVAESKNGILLSPLQYIVQKI